MVMVVVLLTAIVKLKDNNGHGRLLRLVKLGEVAQKISFIVFLNYLWRTKNQLTRRSTLKMHASPSVLELGSSIRDV
ncbi:hypothetical protein L1987_19947 [Smallanthus sonchifolius]|uniref:Uncharacterized protein n=1 Tax=Smallanthus sonchifolius TaxID=185202 RepID=A0ACB9ISJ0_9ASTR|nr:hypothetical protein L1987_19947 [Smallanthus sonchifolius]